MFRTCSAEGDALSVRLEFQVDCLARVWANRADKAWNVLKTGDVDEVMNAASAIGDDTLQRQSHGTVVPEPFMHGTSEQRQRLFRQGLNSGNPDACNTFGVDRI
jgi:predicted metalloprotease